MRPLDSRLRADFDSSAKYSTRARWRVFGLSAARRAIPTSFTGAVGVRSLRAEAEFMWDPPAGGTQRECRAGQPHFRFLFALCQDLFRRALRGRNSFGPENFSSCLRSPPDRSSLKPPVFSAKLRWQRIC